MKSGQQAGFSRSVSPNLAEERVGSGTAGGRQHAGLPFGKQVALGRSSCFRCFLSKISAKSIIVKLEIRGSLVPLIPMLRILANVGPVLPKPKLPSVPPVLSGPDQARFFVSHASRPRERLKDHGRYATDTANTAIIGHAHDDNSPTHWQPPTLAGYCYIVNKSRCE